MKKSDALKPLLQLKNASDIKSFEVVNRYEDDHLECAEVMINGITIEFMWHDSLGFLDYYNTSTDAFNDLKEAISVAYDIAVDMD